MNIHDKLEELESSEHVHPLLWPRTVLHTETIQSRLLGAHGYTDYGESIDNPASRIHQAIEYAKLGLTKNATVLDIGCGDGRILNEIARVMKCDAYGIDINYQKFPIHAEHTNVKFYAIDMLRLFESDIPVNAILMFNTFSAWDRSGTGDRDYLPLARFCEAWVFDHCDYFIADLTEDQIASYSRNEPIYLESWDHEVVVYPGTAATMIKILK